MRRAVEQDRLPSGQVVSTGSYRLARTDGLKEIHETLDVGPQRDRNAA